MTNKPKTKVDELKEALKKKKESESMKSAEPAAEGEDLGAQIEAAEKEAKEHYDKLLRVMAEFENFKKRMTRERDELVKYGNERLLTELLPVLDDLDRVLDHVTPGASDDAKLLAEGVELVRKNILAVLEKFGLKEVAAAGEIFDPARHEAIAMIESDGVEPGAVVAVNRKGYWLNDRLLRPAMVTVAKESEERGTRDEG